MYSLVLDEYRTFVIINYSLKILNIITTIYIDGIRRRIIISAMILK